ncbi:hypothetical protein [Jannaschia formosa]|uniref:hypothetical protein n=1 Tax=Jannaschia formosa TaxID=2259592 RepID=UPI00142FB64F|nr:hypothetical protein [Jannaschia formosa]
MSAQRMAVMALAAPGHPEQTDRGAVADPPLPAALPAGDDACVPVAAPACQSSV